MTSYAEILKQCRDCLGSSPRACGAEEGRYVRLQVSWFTRIIWWMIADKMRLCLRDQGMLRDQGRVVWGVLVQGNSALFKPGGDQALPASVIYSPDKDFDNRVPRLLGLSSALVKLKGTSPRHVQLAQFAAAITDETARTMRLALPDAVREGKEIFLTTCLIEPAHLPGGCLKESFFPLLICPEKTDAVMILPMQYWPEEFPEMWLTGKGLDSLEASTDSDVAESDEVPEKAALTPVPQSGVPDKLGPAPVRGLLERALDFLADRVIGFGTNALGLLLFVLAFLPFILISKRFPAVEEGLLNLGGGILVVALDIASRSLMGEETWVQRGGRFIFLPVWICGVIWILVGSGQSLFALLK